MNSHDVKLRDGTALSPQYVTAGEYWIKLLHASLPEMLYFIWLKCGNPNAEIPEEAERQLLERKYLGEDGVITDDFKALVLCSLLVTQHDDAVDILLQNPRAPITPDAGPGETA